MTRASMVTAALAVTLGAITAAGGQLTREEALGLAFPDATVTAERVFLTEAQRQRAGELAGRPLATALVARFVARKDGAVAGRAYVDTHTVRTKKETLLISLDPAGRVRRVDATAFLEPPEYQAPRPFLDQYHGRALAEDLRLERAIRPTAGATLTARAVTEAVRRVLAIDTVLK